MANFDSSRVGRYYEENTRLLLSLGQGTEGTIHRAVWGPGAKTRIAAMAYVDELVCARVKALQEEQANAAVHALDLGCGVCATLCRVAKQTGSRGTGVTISAKQVALAERRIELAGLSDRVSCVVGDFCSLPSSIERAEIAYAIESFVHAESARSFFQQCANVVKPNGMLMLCDDFVSDAEHFKNRRSRKWLERFQKGWVVGSLLDLVELTALANEYGFVHEETVDLTEFLELGRPRDWAIALLMRSLGWLPVKGSYWSMLYGGHALQVALKRGYLKYLFTVWRRTPTAEATA